MADHLDFKGNRYYAVLPKPKDIQHLYTTNKLRYYKSTGTSDRNLAKDIARELVAGWKREIKLYRSLLSDTTLTSEQLSPQADSMETALLIKKQVEEAAFRDRANLNDIEPWNQEAALLEVTISNVIEDTHKSGNVTLANAIHNVALMGQTPLEPLVNKWVATLHNVTKTIDQRKSDVRLMLERFPTIQSISIEGARQWIDYLTTTKQQNGKQRSANSINRILIGARLLWEYLQDIGLAPHGIKPFDMPKYIKRDREKEKAESVRRSAYTLAEGVKLYHEGFLKHGQQFQDLIHIGMYTGARINEICSLKLTDCSDIKLSIRTSKTRAGVREIPVHEQLKGTINRLLETSNDGFLISGLSSANKYKNRSASMVSMYSRFKTSLGFGSNHVFHSFRHTISTHLLRNGFSKELIAATVGHVSDDFTVDTYASDAFTLAQKAEAINSVQYSF